LLSPLVPKTGHDDVRRETLVELRQQMGVERAGKRQRRVHVAGFNRSLQHQTRRGKVVLTDQGGGKRREAPGPRPSSIRLPIFCTSPPQRRGSVRSFPWRWCSGRREAIASLAVARTATLRFSAFGVVAVGTLLVTGLINAFYLVGSIPALVGTNYGRLLAAKVALFFAMVAVAARRNVAAVKAHWANYRLAKSVVGCCGVGG
jgi:Copper resistance protein D